MSAGDREVGTRPRGRGSRGDGELSHLSLAERAALGNAARAEVPRALLGEWLAPSGRFDPVELLEEQAASRVPELVPIRYGRMLVSPVTFYRGAAYPMAADLARSQNGAALDKALAGFAEHYADQNELDYAALTAAVSTGRVEAQAGL